MSKNTEVGNMLSIAESNRRRILSVLATEPSDWNKLLKETGLSKAVLANHIKELEKRGEIITELSKKDRRKKIYRLSDRGIKEIRPKIEAIYLASKLCRLYYRGEKLIDTIIPKIFYRELADKIGELVVISMKKGHLESAVSAIQIFSRLVHLPPLPPFPLNEWKRIHQEEETMTKAEKIRVTTIRKITSPYEWINEMEKLSEKQLLDRSRYGISLLVRQYYILTESKEEDVIKVLKKKYNDEYLRYYESFKEKRRHILEIAESIKSEPIVKEMFERILLENKEGIELNEGYLEHVL